MLGRLARYLRILGYGTRFDPHLDDDDVIKTCQKTGSLLLTRDAPWRKKPRIFSRRFAPLKPASGPAEGIVRRTLFENAEAAPVAFLHPVRQKAPARSENLREKRGLTARIRAAKELLALHRL